MKPPSSDLLLGALNMNDPIRDLLTTGHARALFNDTVKSHNIQNMSYAEAETFQGEMFKTLTSKTHSQEQTEVLQALGVTAAARKSEIAGSSNPADVMRYSPEQQEAGHQMAVQQAKANLAGLEGGNPAHIEQATRELHGLLNVSRIHAGEEAQPYFADNAEGEKDRARYDAGAAHAKTIEKVNYDNSNDRMPGI